MKPALAATPGADRFTREIEVAAQLQHPHILPLLDSGEADGILCYVMPFVESESLRDRLARHGELPVQDAVKIVCEVVDALAHAHGVVHRDIKPVNVMLSGRHAMVTDFGVAKAASAATGATRLTDTGAGATLSWSPWIPGKRCALPGHRTAMRSSSGWEEQVSETGCTSCHAIQAAGGERPGARHQLTPTGPPPCGARMGAGAGQVRSWLG